MALLEILEFPDPRLRTEARPVADVSDDTRTLIDKAATVLFMSQTPG